MEKVKDFFEHYTNAFLSCDPNVLAPFYHLPCLIHDLDGVHLLDSEKTIKDYETPMLEALKNHGIAKIQCELANAANSTGIPDSIYCTVAYIFENKEGEVLLDLDYDYALKTKGDSYSMLYAQCGAIRVNKL